jgi:hypothetical protein
MRSRRYGGGQGVGVAPVFVEMALSPTANTASAEVPGLIVTTGTPVWGPSPSNMVPGPSCARPAAPAAVIPTRPGQPVKRQDRRPELMNRIRALAFPPVAPAWVILIVNCDVRQTAAAEPRGPVADGLAALVAADERDGYVAVPRPCVRSQADTTMPNTTMPTRPHTTDRSTRPGRRKPPEHIMIISPMS